MTLTDTIAKVLEAHPKASRQTVGALYVCECGQPWSRAHLAQVLSEAVQLELDAAQIGELSELRWLATKKNYQLHPALHAYVNERIRTLAAHSIPEPANDADIQPYCPKHSPRGITCACDLEPAAPTSDAAHEREENR